MKTNTIGILTEVIAENPVEERLIQIKLSFKNHAENYANLLKAKKYHDRLIRSGMGHLEAKTRTEEFRKMLQSQQQYIRLFRKYEEEGQPVRFIVPTEALSYLGLNRSKVSIPMRIINTDRLRPYQKDVIDKIQSEKLTSGIVNMATGAGKGEIMIEIARLFYRNTLVICPGKTLVHQMTSRFEKALGHEFDIYEFHSSSKDKISDININKSRPFVLITTPNSAEKAARELSKVSSIDLLMVDECHKAPISSIRNLVLDSYDYNCFLAAFGFTATLSGRHDRLDQLTKLILGNVIARSTYQDIQDYLSDVTLSYYQINNPKLEGGKEDFPWLYKCLIVLNRARNHLIRHLAIDRMNKGKMVVIFTNHIQHASILHKLIPDSRLLTGESSVEERQEILSGKYKIVICTNIIQHGFDQKAIDVIILAMGGSAEIQTIQTSGRGIRPREGKKLEIIDFIDGGNRIIESHSYKRRDFLRKEYGNPPENVYQASVNITKQYTYEQVAEKIKGLGSQYNIPWASHISLQPKYTRPFHEAIRKVAALCTFLGIDPELWVTICMKKYRGAYHQYFSRPIIDEMITYSL